MGDIKLDQYLASKSAHARAVARENDREKECLARTRGTCALVNVRVGWTEPLAMDRCDACAAAGGIRNSRAAARLREGFAKEMVAQARVDGARRGRQVLVALTVLHGMGEEVSRWLRDEEALFQSNRDGEWQRVKFSWAAAMAFVKSVWSLAEGPIDEGVRAQRVRSCFGGEGMPECPSLRRQDGRAFCGACGCGSTELASLTPDERGRSKLDFPYLECPRGRPGFSNSAGKVVAGDV